MGGEEGVPEAGGDEVVLNGYGAGMERTEEDGEAEDEFEALLSKTMSESVEKTKIARATTQVCTVWPSFLPSYARVLALSSGACFFVSSESRLGRGQPRNLSGARFSGGSCLCSPTFATLFRCWA